MHSICFISEILIGLSIFADILIYLVCIPLLAEIKKKPKNYRELVQIFEDWRDFENPPHMNGA
tara:strand:+ start:509 stop:697 length:189 start_codon:yes stop_codon:yes gene_type:complete